MLRRAREEEQQRRQEKEREAALGFNPRPSKYLDLDQLQIQGTHSHGETLTHRDTHTLFRLQLRLLLNSRFHTKLFYFENPICYNSHSCYFLFVFSLVMWHLCRAASRLFDWLANVS